MKKRMTRKLIALFTTAAMVASMQFTAFAAESHTVTRAEMAKMLVDAAGLSDQAAAYQAQPSAFADVPEGSAYEGYINLASAKGLINGTGGNSFSPDAATSQMEAGLTILNMAGVPAGAMNSWPQDYIDMIEWSGLSEGFTFAPSANATDEVVALMLANRLQVAGKPVIGISWSSNDQEGDYVYYKSVVKEAGGIPVELDQVTSAAVAYGADGKILPAYLKETGNLKQEYADIVKSGNFSLSNVGQVMQCIDGVFFTGGEDISPSLYAVPQAEANNGEEINATRDISDYTLMDYCIENDVPSFAACRGMQIMSIVSGSGFIQDVPNYYAARGAAYNDEHRMPVGVPNRDYARHDVEVFSTGSKWMYNIVKSPSLANVSSWHHQAVENVDGTKLTVVSKKNVGGIDIIEAVERQDKTFCLGVQFHPENDCGIVIYDREPAKALCDYDTCLRFFQTLVSYAAR